MRIGLIDVDNHRKLDSCFPNLPLMKLSAKHKKKGDLVEWVQSDKTYDIVYKSKVFTFTADYDEPIEADQIIKGGTGYAINLENGIEKFDEKLHKNLPYEIEHIYPDYSLYKTNDTAYGFMSRGCGFCHVKAKEGLLSHKVADLEEFWTGQKNIELFDPNTLACKDWKSILQQLIDSSSYVNFNQGVDIRLMTDEKAKMIQCVKINHIHFTYDRYQDKKLIESKLNIFKDKTGWNRDKVSVYVLCNYDTTLDEDLDRIMFLKSLNFNPYVMRYNKNQIPRGSTVNKIARWVNNKSFFWKYETFNDYLEAYKAGLTW